MYITTGWKQPVLADSRRYSWKPEGTHSTVGFPQECAPVVSRDFAPKVDPDVINRSSDLVNRFELLCVIGSDYVSSFCVRPVCLCDWVISQPVLCGSSSREFVPGVRAGSSRREVRAGSSPGRSRREFVLEVISGLPGAPVL